MSALKRLRWAAFGLGTTILALAGAGSASAATVFQDNFVSPPLGASWQWQNPGATASYTISGGAFNLKAGGGNDQWIGIDRGPRLLKDQPASTDWTIETRITASNGNASTHVGLTVFADASNFLMWGQLSNSSLEASGIVNNTFTGQTAKMATKYNYLRLRKAGSSYFFDASPNGVNWTNANVYNDPAGHLSGAKVGFLAKDWNATTSPGFTTSFDYYKEDDQDLMSSVLSSAVTTTQIAKETGADSINHTDAVNLCGTDLGELFDWLGKTFIAFGDTNACNGGPQRSNALAYTTDTTPADGLTFDGWATGSDGLFKQLFGPEPGAITAIPTSGVGIGSTAYLYYMQVTDWSNWSCNKSGIASAASGNIGAWTKRSITWGPGNFNMVAARQEGSTLYIWGTPCGRYGSVKLMKVPTTSVLTKSAYRYFSGYDIAGNPLWSTSEGSAITVAGGPAGELSVTYNNWLGRYVMTYLDEEKDAIVLRESPSPWGRWSAPIEIASASQSPQLYGAFMKSNFVENNGQSIYYMMSQFGPYNTYWMKSSLTLK